MCGLSAVFVQSDVQVMLGRREAVTLLLVDGRAKDTVGKVPLPK